MKTPSLSEALQADRLYKKAGHTSASVSLRNLSNRELEEQFAFFGDDLNFCGIKQVIK